jgi:hypothetical protein
MNKENIKNVEFLNSTLVDKVNLISNEYSMPFDTLVNIAVLKFIDDVNLLRQLRNGSLNGCVKNFL